MASTFLTSIPAALILYDPVLNDTDYILGAGDDTRVTLGALLEIFLMIGNVGTAVVMFPILRRYSETLSLSYVASRTIEATIIGVGAISLLSVVTLRDDLAASIGADGTSLNIAGQSLVAIHDWTFLLGPGFCVGVNGILLGWMMYRTGLMPPRLAMLGVIGGPLIFLSAIAVLFGVYEQDGLHALFSIPEGAFELAFAIYLIVKGFRPSPILDDARFGGGATAPYALRLRRSRPTAASAALGEQRRRAARHRTTRSPASTHATAAPRNKIAATRRRRVTVPGQKR